MSDEKIIKNIGEIDGKLLFFGGVYSNLQALKSLKVWADENDFVPDNIFCTGDILGYCAQPIECIELMKEWKIHSLAGNVELQVRNDEDNCGCDFAIDGRCDLFSKNWYSYIQTKMDKVSRDWLHSLPHHIQFKYGNDKITLVHGSWFQTSEFIFNSTPWHNKHKNFEACDSHIIIAGHCGLPFIHQQEQYAWLNPGVIGMPANDGSNKVWFLTVDIKDGKFTYQFHQLEYDYKTAKRLMLENKLPISYAQTLETGIWDNSEILPVEETTKQGEKIIL